MLASCSVGYYSDTRVITTANISLQPAWGPAGYDCAHYYYFPDFNFYYDVNNALFYYLSGNRWLSARQLPYALGYPRDLYKFYKVVLNIHNPWKYNRTHRREYKHFCGMHNQPVLRDNRPQSRPPQPSHMQRPQDRPNNGYKPSPGNRQPQARPPQNDNRQPQARPPQNNNRQPQAKPPQGNRENDNLRQPQNNRGNGYNSGSDYRNTVRDSRNNNTSRNNVAPQQGNSQRGNTNVQKPQSSKPKQGSQPTSGNRNNSSSVKGSRGNSKPAQATQTKSSGTSRSTTNNNSNSSSSSRSTGSRGR